MLPKTHRVWKHFLGSVLRRSAAATRRRRRIEHGKSGMPVAAEVLEQRVLLSTTNFLAAGISGAVTALGRTDADVDVVARRPADAGPKWHSSQIIVRFHEDAFGNGRVPEAVPGTGLKRPLGDVPGLYLVELKGAMSVEAAVAAYESNPLVMYAGLPRDIRCVSQ